MKSVWSITGHYNCLLGTAILASAAIFQSIIARNGTKVMWACPLVMIEIYGKPVALTKEFK